MKGNKTHSGTGSHAVPTNGADRARLVVGGTFVGTVVAEYSNDGWATSRTLPILKSDGTFAVSVTAAGTYDLPFLPTVGHGAVRARVSAYTSGEPTTEIVF